MKREMKTIKDFASKGEQHDIMHALTILTHAYISQCGRQIDLDFKDKNIVMYGNKNENSNCQTG